MDEKTLSRILTPPRMNFDTSAFKSPELRSAELNDSMRRRMVAEQGRNLVAIITDRVKRYEASLQEGESLVVLCDAGPERIAVQAIEFPNWHLAIITGVDSDGNMTHRIENVQDVKLTCKVLKGLPKKNPIGFSFPSESEAKK